MLKTTQFKKVTFEFPCTDPQVTSETRSFFHTRFIRFLQLFRTCIVPGYNKCFEKYFLLLTILGNLTSDGSKYEDGSK